MDLITDGDIHGDLLGKMEGMKDGTNWSPLIIHNKVQTYNPSFLKGTQGRRGTHLLAWYHILLLSRYYLRFHLQNPLRILNPKSIPQKRAHSPMYPPVVTIGWDNICFIFWYFMHQVCIRLPSPPSLYDWLKKFIKSNPNCPFLLRLLQDPRPLFYEIENQLHQLPTHWLKANMCPSWGEVMVEVKSMNSHFFHKMKVSN